MTIKIIRYNNNYKDEWDNFVKNSKNSTFLFYRDFMDYHADRFTDHSLIFYKNDKLIGLLPACEFDREQDTAFISSHGGLSYGGVLSDLKMTAQLMLEIFQNMISYYKNDGFNQLKYKTIPHIYHKYPAEEDIYALFRNNADLIQVDNSTCIYLDDPIAFAKGKKCGMKKALKNGVICNHEPSLKDFFILLENTLNKRHQVQATHSFEEMKLLQSRFPENIKLHTACLNDEIIAGALVFITEKVVHTQYLAACETGRDLGALDLLLYQLINDTYKNKTYFNFGISNEDKGRILNTGLCKQKEMLGGRSIAHTTYSISNKNI